MRPVACQPVVMVMLFPVQIKSDALAPSTANWGTAVETMPDTLRLSGQTGQSLYQATQAITIGKFFEIDPNTGHNGMADPIHIVAPKITIEPGYTFPMHVTTEERFPTAPAIALYPPTTDVTAICNSARYKEKTSLGVPTRDTTANSAPAPVEEALPNESKNGILAVSPNPSAGTFTVRYNLNQTGKVTIRLGDLSGGDQQVLFEAASEPAGIHERRFEPTGLKPGVYLLTLTTASSMDTRRLIIH
jgi:hypothetical protein